MRYIKRILIAANLAVASAALVGIGSPQPVLADEPFKCCKEGSEKKFCCQSCLCWTNCEKDEDCNKN